ncbi:hypothetical protein HUJ04_006991 [Dendroctonus ponderosae]|nr:hypothetical protein HUJ04_006991 [Dendroctonus ponderosae]
MKKILSDRITVEMKVSASVISLIYIIAMKDCQALANWSRIFFNNFFGFSGLLGVGNPVQEEVSDLSTEIDDDQDESRNCSCECGVSNHENRIVGGRPTGINHYPWIARIVYDGHFHCGGSLVAESYVLTAAHCVRK